MINPKNSLNFHCNLSESLSAQALSSGGDVTCSEANTVFCVPAAELTAVSAQSVCVRIVEISDRPVFLFSLSLPCLLSALAEHLGFELKGMEQPFIY